MALSPFLMGFPLLVLIVSVGLAGGNYQGNSGSFSICNPNSTAQCTTGSQGTTYTCPTGGAANCIILQSCPTPPIPSPAYCAFVGVGPALTLLPAGTSVTVPPGSSVPSSSTNGIFFSFGTIATSGFTAVIVALVGLAVLVGISALGIGLGFESVHILFMGVALFGLWVFLSALDGFLSGSNSSMLIQLNFFKVGTLGAGNVIYVLLTLMYLTGFIGVIKRGN